MTTQSLPQFLVIEGVDGVGKSTLAQRVCQELGYDYRYPVPAPLAEIRSKIEDLKNLDARFFYYLACNVTLQKNLRADLSAGKRIVLDRYVFSTFASHEAMGSCLGGITVTHVPFIVPDLSLLLTCDPAVRNARILRRGKEGEEYIREHGSILDQTEQRLLSFTLFTEINTTTMTEDEVFAAVKQLLHRKSSVR